MYAVIETGGKQYQVKEGDIVFIEKLGIDAEENITFDKVVLLGKDDGMVIGAPYVESASVAAKVLKNGRGKKIRIFTYKPKKGSSRRMGHRQPYSQVRIESINGQTMVIAKFTMRASDEQFIGFDVSGHADYADEGEDIVCAGVSSAVMLTANTITECYKSNAKVFAGDGSIKLELERDCNDRGVLMSMQGLHMHLGFLSEDFPGAVAVSVKKVQLIDHKAYSLI